MADNHPQDEHTYVIEAENAAEMARLVVQGRLITNSMGGLLPEQGDLSHTQRILDIACGPGGWVLDVAQAYPEKQVVGVDISQLMIEYARHLAREKELHNAKFRVMDGRKPLDFPDNSFDLVNARLIFAFMPPAAWPAFIQECMRILRPGGVIRLTELELNLSTSPAFEQMIGICAQSLWLAKQSFSPDGRHAGITPLLGRFLREAGYHNIQRIAHILDFSAGEEAHNGFYQDYRALFKLMQPFFLKTGAATHIELERLYQQVLAEMQESDFCGVLFLLTVWGNKPE